MTHALVIGGSGFIGCQVSRILVEKGREVVILGRGAERTRSLPAGCRYVCGDYGNQALLRSLLSPGCDVVHLAYATVPKTSFGDPVFDLMANLPPSVGLLQEALQVGVHRLVIVSSGGTVYGAPQQLPIVETHPTHPISPYGITKLSIDSYALMFHATSDLPVQIVRPANAYGEGQRAGVGQGFIAAAVDAVLKGRTIEIYGATGTIRDYIHVVDVAEAICAALQDGRVGEIYNIGTGCGASNLDVIHLLEPLASEAGLSVNVKHLPERRFDVAANVLDPSKLMAATSWRPQVDLDRGVRRVWEDVRRRLAS